MRFIVNTEDNSFQEWSKDIEEEMTEGEFFLLEDDEVEFVQGSIGDIRAIFAYQEGKETRIGIVDNDDEVLIQANISGGTLSGLRHLLNRRHNEHNA